MITRSTPIASAPSKASKWQQSLRCFLCSTKISEKRHFLYNCDNYQRLTLEEKRNAIIQAYRFLICLQSHSVEDCKFPCKCKHCKQRMAVPKHTTLLHEIYTTSFPTYPSENISSTERVAVGAAPLPSYNQKASTLVVRKIEAQQTGILTRISAVQISNPCTRKNTLIYAQHDPGSQVTLISKTLLKELDLVPLGKSRITLHTILSNETSELEN